MNPIDTCEQPTGRNSWSRCVKIDYRNLLTQITGNAALPAVRRCLAAFATKSNSPERQNFSILIFNSPKAGDTLVTGNKARHRKLL